MMSIVLLPVTIFSKGGDAWDIQPSFFATAMFPVCWKSTGAHSSIADHDDPTESWKHGEEKRYCGCLQTTAIGWPKRPIATESVWWPRWRLLLGPDDCRPYAAETLHSALFPRSGWLVMRLKEPNKLGLPHGDCEFLRGRYLGDQNI